MLDLVLLPKLCRTRFQSFKIVTQEVNVGIDSCSRVLDRGVFLLNDTVNCLDQTGQVVVERPSEDEDDESVVTSVVPETFRTNRITIRRPATFRAREVEISADFFTGLRTADKFFRARPGDMGRQHG